LSKIISSRLWPVRLYKLVNSIASTGQASSHSPLLILTAALAVFAVIPFGSQVAASGSDAPLQQDEVSGGRHEATEYDADLDD
jgi:hypothetical protein